MSSYHKKDENRNVKRGSGNPGSFGKIINETIISSTNINTQMLSDLEKLQADNIRLSKELKELEPIKQKCEEYKNAAKQMKFLGEKFKFALERATEKLSQMGTEYEKLRKINSNLKQFQPQVDSLRKKLEQEKMKSRDLKIEIEVIKKTSSSSPNTLGSMNRSKRSRSLVSDTLSETREELMSRKQEELDSFLKRRRSSNAKYGRPRKNSFSPKSSTLKLPGNWGSRERRMSESSNFGIIGKKFFEYCEKFMADLNIGRLESYEIRVGIVARKLDILRSQGKFAYSTPSKRKSRKNTPNKVSPYMQSYQRAGITSSSSKRLFDSPSKYQDLDLSVDPYQRLRNIKTNLEDCPKSISFIFRRERPKTEIMLICQGVLLILRRTHTPWYVAREQFRGVGIVNEIIKFRPEVLLVNRTKDEFEYLQNAVKAIEQFFSPRDVPDELVHLARFVQCVFEIMKKKMKRKGYNKRKN